jgi:hypothetical protein
MTFTLRQQIHAGLPNATNGRLNATSGLEDSTESADTNCISKSWNNPD